MVKLYSSSELFSKEAQKYVPRVVVENINPKTLQMLLKFIGIYFVVLPRKDIPTMTIYLLDYLPRLWKGNKVAYKICSCLAHIFTWMYPTIIILLLIALFPLSVVIGICLQLRTPRKWIDEIRDIDIILSRIILGTLLVCSFLRIFFEFVTLVLYVFASLHLIDNGIFVGYFIVTCLWLLLSLPLVYIWNILSLILSKPFGILLNFPVQIVSLFIYRPILRLSSALKTLLNILLVVPSTWLFDILNNIGQSLFYCYLQVVYYLQKTGSFIISIPTIFFGLLQDYFFYILPIILLVVALNYLLGGNKDTFLKGQTPSFESEIKESSSEADISSKKKHFKSDVNSPHFGAHSAHREENAHCADDSRR